MSSPLKQNTTTIQNLLNTINNLPTGGGTPNLQSKTASPTTSQQVITPDSNYDGLDKVTIAAMPSGTAGTPTATKGTPSNHALTVIPKVTNTTGYITGGTKTGTGVTVSASELVSGTLSVTENGTHDVTNYASVNVDVAGNGGGGSVETCTVTIITPPNVSIFGYGMCSIYVSSNGGSSWTVLNPENTLPSTSSMSHTVSMLTKRIFTNLPVGSTFTFWNNGKVLLGAECSNTIEFAMANHGTSATYNFYFAMCKCNGDGEITILT